jgi:hypothetical protein
MITNIMVALQLNISSFSLEAGADTAANQQRLEEVLNMFHVSGLIPSYFFQVVVGIYVVQLAYILTILQNGIENGSDKINEQNLLGKNMTRSFILYAVISLIVTIIFTVMAQNLMSGSLA